MPEGPADGGDHFEGLRSPLRLAPEELLPLEDELPEISLGPVVRGGDPLDRETGEQRVRVLPEEHVEVRELLGGRNLRARRLQPWSVRPLTDIPEWMLYPEVRELQCELEQAREKERKMRCALELATNELDEAQQKVARIELELAYERSRLVPMNAG